MPIDIETFESAPEDRLRRSDTTNAERVMRFLGANPDQAFTQGEISERAGVKTGSISVVLSRLEKRGLVRHRGHYWALGEEADLSSYTDLGESTRTANERFGEEDMDEWLEYAVDEDEQ